MATEIEHTNVSVADARKFLAKDLILLGASIWTAGEAWIAYEMT
jgi:hypothetical protein